MIAGTYTHYIYLTLCVTSCLGLYSHGVGPLIVFGEPTATVIFFFSRDITVALKTANGWDTVEAVLIKGFDKWQPVMAQYVKTSDGWRQA